MISPDYTHKYIRGKNSEKTFRPTPGISKLMRDVFRPRFDWWPYVLHPYFDTQLLIAESKGKMAHDFHVFFMGHRGTMEARHITNKDIIFDVLLGEMRYAFARSEEFLEQVDATDSVLMENKRQSQAAIDDATPEQFDLVLEALQRTGKITGQVAVATS